MLRASGIARIISLKHCICKYKVTETLNNFHDRLAFVLRLRGATNSELARLTEVNSSTVGRWLANTRPHPAVLARIAKALQVRAEWLLHGLGSMDLVPGEEEPEVKDVTAKTRHFEIPPVYRSLLPPAAPASTPTISSAAARLTEEELEEIITDSMERLKLEVRPMMKLGYIATLKACVADLERRLLEQPKE